MRLAGFDGDGVAKIRFFTSERAPTVAEIAEWAGAELALGVDRGRVVRDVAPLDAAGPGDLTFVDDPAPVGPLEATRAAAIFVTSSQAARAPAGCAVLLTPHPSVAMARAMERLFPAAARPESTYRVDGVSERAHVHPEAILETGVRVDPGAVVGPGARVGAGTLIGANAVVGAKVCIGRDSSVGPGASVIAALVGDRVVIHAGARIGQDGFGYTMGPRGARKIPRIGRVILQDDVEVGANTTIDRGAYGDTIVGEGTKVDSLAQICADAAIGRHCAIWGQTRVCAAGALEDFATFGG